MVNWTQTLDFPVCDPEARSARPFIRQDCSIASLDRIVELRASRKQTVLRLGGEINKVDVSSYDVGNAACVQNASANHIDSLENLPSLSIKRCTTPLQAHNPKTITTALNAILV